MSFPEDFPISFGAAPNTLEHTSDVAERARALLLYVFKDKPRINGVLDAVSAQLQELEDASFDVRLQRAIDNAEGEQLNVIGRVVGEERAGLEDPIYRSRIRVRVLINRSNGKHEEILKIFRIFEANETPETFELRGAYPASLVFTHHSAPTTSVNEITRLLRSIKPGGVGLEHVYVPDDVDFSFVFGDASDAPEDDSDEGFGDSNDDATGGDLAGVVSV